MGSARFILGPEGEALEREVAGFCRVRHALGVASGTDAIELALRACGIGSGDEVITSAFSFFASVEAIAAVGATPIFADIDLETFCLDPRDVERRLSPRTKALLPVHLYGHPADLDALSELARRHRLRVIEDCAQAIGARLGGRPLGSIGDAGAFSFYPTKNLGGCGDGGLVTTNDDELARRIRLLRHHGDQGRYEHVVLGTNSRLDEVQAAVLRVKLRHLNDWNEARRHHAAQYAASFAKAGVNDVTLPAERPGAHHVYHLYTILARRRDALKAALDRAGIATQIYYPSLIPDQPALGRPVDTSAFPRARQAVAEVLSVPMYPELPPGAIDQVVDAVAHALKAV